MLTKPINFSLTAISYSGETPGDRSPDVDVEHISIKHHHHFPLGSTVVEAVNRGVQTNIRTDARSYFCKSCTTRETAGSCSSILNSRLVNGQVVSLEIPTKKPPIKLVILPCFLHIFLLLHPVYFGLQR